MESITKYKKISISRSGFKIDKLYIDTETIALHIPTNEKKDADIFKKAFVERLNRSGILVKFEKDIHYKRPFWKFWGVRDYSIAIYKLLK